MYVYLTPARGAQHTLSKLINPRRLIRHGRKRSRAEQLQRALSNCARRPGRKPHNLISPNFQARAAKNVVFNRRRSFSPTSNNSPLAPGVFTQSASFVLETLLEWRFFRPSKHRAREPSARDINSLSLFHAYRDFFFVVLRHRPTKLLPGAVADVQSQLQEGFVVTLFDQQSSWNDDKKSPFVNKMNRPRHQ